MYVPWGQSSASTLTVMHILYEEVEADNNHFSALVCHWTCLWAVAYTFSTNNAVPSMIDMALKGYFLPLMKVKCHESINEAEKLYV